VTIRVLTWNLLHGRSLPDSGRDLLPEFTRALSGWEWDVAALQEVPPWWPAALGAQLGASARLVLTSRNSLLPVRRAIARRWPDVIRSNGGGCNAILVRGRTVLEHRKLRLCRLPERRWLHAVRIAGGAQPSHGGAQPSHGGAQPSHGGAQPSHGGAQGSHGSVWVGNLHATAHRDPSAWRDGRLAATAALRWAAAEPLVLTGDFNLLAPAFVSFRWAGGHDVDHAFVAGLEPVEALVLDRGSLSDHAPLLVTLRITRAERAVS
jgi:endonuclease/exonuclease/phosphatase family metal-dependent hydrolase